MGTSGFEYDHWRGSFYESRTPRSRWLEVYAGRFDTVELNATFYRLPAGETFARWGERVPDGFRYAVKASRYLTHVRRLREPAEPLERLWTRASRMGAALGPVLYQLPPRWRANPERLQTFLAALPRHPQAIEFRDARWYREETFHLLEGAGVALCLHDMPGSEPPPTPIGPFVYLRFHGAGSRYGGRYPSQRLRAWADRIAAWTADGLTVWAYFNNDLGGHAPRDAARLREMVARRGVRC
ncbi:MAG: DUF72 domain-containing protein [Chloroflexi bacterium]|nr:DUF72 domain-containing protein [Chloroflexota bacterium]